MPLEILPFQRIVAQQVVVERSYVSPLQLVPADCSSQRPTSPQLREAWRHLNARRDHARPLNSVFVDNALEQTHDDAEEIVMQQTTILRKVEAGVYGPEHSEQVEAEWRHLRKRGKAKRRRRADNLRAMLEADVIAAEQEEAEEEENQAIQPASLIPVPPTYPTPEAPACHGALKWPRRPLAHSRDVPVDLTLRRPRGSPRKLPPTATLKRRQVKLAEQLGLSSCEMKCKSVYDRSYEDELRARSRKRRQAAEEAAARAIQIRWQYYRLRTHMLLINATLTCAAEVIQSWWRTLLDRRQRQTIQNCAEFALYKVYSRAETMARAKVGAC